MFKPMLAARVPEDYDLADLPYPLLGSPKYDGVRATIQHGEVLSRKLKLIPNVFTQELFGNQPELNGLDGELILGDPCAEGVFNRTSGAVRRRDGKPDITYYVFDKYSDESSVHRQVDLIYTLKRRKFFCSSRIIVVQQLPINNLEELLDYEGKLLIKGYEGLMLRKPDSPYKQGRSTFNQGWLIKIKRFVDDEAVVTGTFELEHNENPAEVNELGKTKRSKHKANMVKGDTLGGLICTDMRGQEFRIGSGFTQEQRDDLWARRELIIGEMAKFKYQAYGTKNRPRTPIFLGFRMEED